MSGLDLFAYSLFTATFGTFGWLVWDVSHWVVDDLKGQIYKGDDVHGRN